MPQTRGSCGHIRAAWDNHGSCLSCAGCTQDNCCPFCVHWSADTWAIKRRPFKSRGRNKNSSDQSRESFVCRDFSPHDLYHTPPVAARHRSLPRDDTGQNLPGPFIWNDQLNDSASDQRRKSSVCRDFSPHDLDHMPPVAARHRSLPRDDTGQNLPGPFIGNDQLTGPETSPVRSPVML
ncbi:hypothetical protein DPMN_054726 [Dreissena polymorpha]|uniref:Uncharacterized protein n=1 Tax=Dreissena polymorpha TaxID=45954 RepID=A0A9D4CR49_DREPO|nr:hypothetical protein DPMN_054726 [Dreissena polymorpha]